jgi:hypothetical protein
VKRPLILQVTLAACILQPALGQVISTGDVFASTQNGRVLQYSPDGRLKRTLETGRNGILAGLAFDRSGNLYVTAFNDGDVVRFDAGLNFKGVFGQGYENNPESAIFDATGNLLVGAAQSSSGLAAIKKLDPNGHLLETFHVERDRRGADWIDLSADRKTIYYTSEGPRVKRFDLDRRAQLPDFADGGDVLFALRILPGGDVLAANTHNIVHFDRSGKMVRTYLPNSDILFALNLDPDRATFWTGDLNRGDVYRVEIASGKVLTTIRTGQGIAGLAIYGELTASASFEPPKPPPPPPPPTGNLSFRQAVPCVFGPLRSKSEGRSELDLSGAAVTGYVDVEVRSPFHVSGAALEIDTPSGWQTVGSRPIHLRVDEFSSRKWPVRIRVADCPGPIGSPPPEIEVRTTTPQGKLEQLRIPVQAEIVPDSWLHCWWPMLAALAGLLVGAFIFYGFWSPFRFPPRVGVMLAQEEDLDNEGFFYPIRGQPGSGAGFYRDAVVYVCQDFRIAGKAANPLVKLRAGRKQVRMKPVLSVWRRTSEGEWNELPPEEAAVRTGVLHRNESGSLYFEIRTR